MIRKTMSTRAIPSRGWQGNFHTMTSNPFLRHTLAGMARQAMREHKHMEDTTKMTIPALDADFYLVLAARHEDNGEYAEAVECLDEAIRANPDDAYCYFRRAFTRRFSGDFSGAISDMDKAVELEPDSAEYRQKRAAVVAHYLSEHDIPFEERKPYLERIEQDYLDSLERDPAVVDTVLGLLEVMLLAHKFDEAVAYAGSCAQRMALGGQRRVVLSWLTCLALIFAGEEIEDEDIAPLRDETIRVHPMTWCVAEVNGFFRAPELAEHFPEEKIAWAREIHRLFLDKFDGEPLGGRLE